MAGECLQARLGLAMAGERLQAGATLCSEPFLIAMATSGSAGLQSSLGHAEELKSVQRAAPAVQ